ncbi:hypothetical protein PV325_009910 [Microctonus aethiopoides]|uniref:BRISC and BRCA1-A complex member 1 n=1 Tax=Microctonus aethiopoides TaxID=144406 RepID=A0AA39FK80_9HYME|nr:hypothetical protein PV325_009910 [Microctonus aethiopoides]KAK0096444.1 hypothetical protein PV326_005469 [Microctonus aethiopoides]KAK0171048.1 hypothetical protein PV328_008813 [Microctonus aethiopoides]
MADECLVDDDVCMISQKLESISANDTTNQNYSRIQNNKTMNNSTGVNYHSSEHPNSRIVNQREEMKLPAINLPEKILIIIDTVRESDCTPFEFGCGAKYSPLEVIKRAVQFFICTKSTINPKHEYALMILSADSAKLICDFTNDGKKLLNTLKEIQEIILSDAVECFDLDTCFQIIPEFSIVNGIYPTHVNRVILIYTRSNCVPVFHTTNNFEMFMMHKYYFFDALFVHEPPSDDNGSEYIYAKLSELDIKNNSWIFEVGRNAAQLHTQMAKLLAHPLQRPKQDSANYQIALTDTTEKQTNV